MTDTNTAQMVVDLKATDDAVRANGWVAPGLGVPGAPLGLLETAFNPLSGLAAAGLGWFMPLVSFLGDGLTQLQGGNGASVTSGSQDFGAAGQDIAGVADSYRASTSAQTSEWSGEAATEYRNTAAQHADGVEGLGQASTMTGSAIIGAGQVVAQAIAEVTELIAEAVAQIVPIMTQAIARAAETFGQSVVEAIPPCVGIAVEYALRIAAKLAALVASGDNLMKLVQGGMAVVDLIQTALSSISQQSISAEAQAGPGGGGQQQGGGGAASTMDDLRPAGAGSTEPTSSASTPSSGGSGSGFGGAPTPAGSSRPGGPGGLSATPPGIDTRPSGMVPPVLPSHGAVPGPVGGSGVSTGGVPGGGAPIGAAALGGLASGARSGADTVRQEGRQQQGAARASRSGGGAPGAVPMGAMGAGRAAGDSDKEHQRKYHVYERHDDGLEVAPPIITSDR